MPLQLISRSSDLKRLRDEGYDVVVKSGYLMVRDIPYLDSNRVVKKGVLISNLTLAANMTIRPNTHVAHFAGDYPHHSDGKPIDQIRHQSGRRSLANEVVIDHSFSSKPTPSGYYDDYYHKMTTYAAILSSPAQAIDSTVTAKTFPIVEPGEEETVFNYIDTASSRAEIVLATKKLELDKVAIIGLGGTGAYVLDLVAKTPVKQIHMFDGDTFSQHNAFRAPGAAALDDLRSKPQKVAYLYAIYSKMRKGIIPHEVYLDEDSFGLLEGMTFVFLCLDQGSAKSLIIDKLEALGIPFIDVGMGMDIRDDNSLGGIIRITTSTPATRARARANIPFSNGAVQNEYARNIQIADLNALNAALAVIKWKKLFGFYCDLEHEYHSAYTIDGNHLSNEAPCEITKDSQT